MDLRWIKVTPELKNAIEIINKLDDLKYSKFLSHIKESFLERPKNELFTSEEIVALERVFKMSSEEVSLIVKVTLYILDKMSKFLMQPSSLSYDLVNVLMLKEEKAEDFIDVWQSLLRDTFEEYNVNHLGEIEEVVESNWQMNVSIGSYLNKKEKLSTVLLHLKTSNEPNSAKEKTFVELTHDELLNFNSQLENVQFEIDNLLNSYLQ